MNLMAACTAGRLRFIVPTCTSLLERAAASIIRRPSSTVCDAGFSTNTCLPACRPHTVARACQWFGAAITIASMSLSSSTRRRSCTKPGLNDATSFSRSSWTRDGARLASGSHSVLTSTFDNRAKPRFSALPWPRMPMLASTTRLLAPITRLPTCGAALSCAPSQSPPTTAPAVATPSRVLKSRREMPL